MCTSEENSVWTGATSGAYKDENHMQDGKGACKVAKGVNPGNGHGFGQIEMNGIKSVWEATDAWEGG